MKVKLLVDSTFNLSNEFIEENNIAVIPLNVNIDGKTYLDQVDITLDEVMEAVHKGKKVTTSQPTPYSFHEYYTRIRDEGYTDIICMTLSSTLSGTFQSANIGKEGITDVNIHIIDTLSASIGAEMLARIVVDELKIKTSINDIIAKLTKIKENACIILSMENLTAMKKSGRISRIKATIGNLLRVKPIAEYLNGELTVNSKFRTDSQVMEWIIGKMKIALSNITSKIHIFLGHVRAEERVKKLKDYIMNAFPNVHINSDRGITPVIAINIGYGGIGVSFCYE